MKLVLQVGTNAPFYLNVRQQFSRFREVRVICQISRKASQLYPGEYDKSRHTSFMKPSSECNIGSRHEI